VNKNTTNEKAGQDTWAKLQKLKSSIPDYFSWNLKIKRKYISISLKNIY